jgi:adenylate kinase family enzyme
MGMPCSGKGTIVKALHEKLLDVYRTTVISTSDIVKKIITEEDKEIMKNGVLFPRETELRAELGYCIERVYALGTQLILLDGFPRFDDQVRWLRQTFYASPLEFYEVRAQDDFELVKRASLRNRDEFDQPEKFKQRLSEQRKLFSAAESMIQYYALPYRTIMNVDTTLAVSNAMQWINKNKLKEFIDAI